MNDRTTFDDAGRLRESPINRSDRLEDLKAYLDAMQFDAADWYAVGEAFRRLVDAGFDRLPLPGGGGTAQRWNSLAAVAGRDLSLVKLFEGHTDARAILMELSPDYAGGHAYWGVWAAESPAARVTASPCSDAVVLLDGTKQWCSGAATLSHALVTGWLRDGISGLYAVELNQPGVVVASGSWHAVGMQASASVEVRFERVEARRIGAAGAYTSRPGFWQGGAGIAACWYGAAAALAQAVQRAAMQRPNPHRNAHLGSIMVALGNAAASLREAARAIDRMPCADARWLALRTRLSIEHAASAVLEHAGRALGAGPSCLDAQVARVMADLPVFMRQNHAEHDLAALGEFAAHHDGAHPSLPDDFAAGRIWQI
jgi:hypothetical protein